MNHSCLTQARASELLSYDRDTGILRWKVTLGSRAIAGNVAGSLNKKSGYLTVRLDKRNYHAHRVIWLMETSEWPFQIDHRNRIRHENWWDNLRPTCDALNRQNVEKARSDSATGVQGVSIDKRTGLLMSKIKLDGRSIYLGSYPSIDLASSVYQTAKLQLHQAWVPSADFPLLEQLRDNHLLHKIGNRRVRSDSRSGIPGVYPWKQYWRARFKRKHIGTFETIEEATNAVSEAKSKLLTNDKDKRIEELSCH